MPPQTAPDPEGTPVAALFRHRVFAVTYRATTVRERSTRTHFPRSAKHPGPDLFPTQGVGCFPSVPPVRDGFWDQGAGFFDAGSLSATVENCAAA
jgi:hypothetical protein